MKKKIMCLLMAVFMLMHVSLTVHAEHYQGSDGWKVEFLGNEIVSNFQSNQIQEEVYNIQPGDSVIFEMALENNSDIATDWYMTNEVIRTLEESNDCAEGGAYTYILTYMNTKGEETILYTSEVVGGEKDNTSEGEGLHQATNNLEEFFYLDRLAAGENAAVKLFVMLDGETQGNDYQSTLARLQMNFAVEKVVTETIINHITVTENKVVTNVITNVVQTGDENPLVLLSLVSLVCGVILFAMAIVFMKRHREDGEEQQ